MFIRWQKQELNRMRKSAIDYITALADEEDYIQFITAVTPPISIKHKFLSYEYQEYCIKINDKYRKEWYMIQLESIEAVKLITPKFRGLKWYDGMDNRKVGA